MRSKTRSGTQARTERTFNRASTKPKRERVNLDDAVDDDDRRDYAKNKVKTKRKEAVKSNKLVKTIQQSLEDTEDGEDVSLSVFEDAFKELKKTLSAGNADINLDMSTPAFLRATLLTLTDLIPIAERTFRKTHKETSAYAFTALINQAREIQNDLRITEDLDSKLLIIHQIIDATIRGIAQSVMTEKFAFQSRFNTLTNDLTIRKAMRKETDAMVSELASTLESHKFLLSDRIRAFMNGNPNYMNPNAEVPTAKKNKSKRRREED